MIIFLLLIIGIVTYLKLKKAANKKGKQEADS
jgi:hypothetical protein